MIFGQSCSLRNRIWCVRKNFLMRHFKRCSMLRHDIKIKHSQNSAQTFWPFICWQIQSTMSTSTIVSFLPHTHYKFYFNIYQSMHCWNRWRYNSIGEEYRVFVCLVGGISEIDINYALHVPIQLCTTILMPQTYECTFRYEWWHLIIAEIDDVHAINACLCIRRKITMLLNTFSIGCGLSSHAIRNDEDNFN